MDLKDWLNSINMSKENLIDEDPDLESKYPPFIVNKCLSGQTDSLMFANEMNRFPQLDHKLQYDFFLNSLRKRKRFSPWLRKDKVDNIAAIREYYGFSTEKAEHALNILTTEQINFIHGKLDKGGTQRCSSTKRE
jgi:hypothetical protein